MPKTKKPSASSSNTEGQQKEELDVFTMTHILSYLDSAGDPWSLHRAGQGLAPG